MGTPTGMAEFTGLPKLSQLRAILDLTDIAAMGQAEQSSLSKWSKPGDAQNAVRGVNRDFAFHTGPEHAPWWSLTFVEPRALNYLVLENRRTLRFRHLADHLTIKIQTVDQTLILHEIVQRFGTEDDDSALVISLSDVPPVARITIIAHTHGGHFHLSRVRALAKGVQPDWLRSDRMQDKPLYFIANRNDGFGERLRAVLNAMVAADRFGGKMILNWQPLPEEIFKDNVVLPIQETFSEDFLKSCHFNPLRSEKSGNNQPNIATFDGDGRISCRTNVDAIIMDQRLISEQVEYLAGVDFRPLYIKAFDDICFTPMLEIARAAARDAVIGEQCVAVHLRAGDIVYGRFRTLGGFTTKAIPYPVIEALIKQVHEGGGNVILFGQDAALCRHLAARYSVRLVTDFAASATMNKYQSALFEICLMSRCQRIYSGSSGFATLASWIGDAKSLTVDKVFRDREILDIIMAGTGEVVDGISALQKAYANFYILHRLSNYMTKAQKRSVINRCVSLDPENVLYTIIDAANLYSEGCEVEAEVYLKEFSHKDVELNIAWILAYTAHTNMVRRHLPSFKAPAEAGYPMAALCLALREQALGNNDEAKRYAGLYRANKGDLVTPLEIHLKG